MSDLNFLAAEQTLSTNASIEAMIKQSCIVDFGIIQSVPENNEGIVDVAVAVAKTKENMYCMRCVLADTASSSITVKIKPSVGDRVLVLYPRFYNSAMFNVADNEADRKKVTVDSNAGGYNLISGIAILMNQYKKNGHKNVISIEDGAITVTSNTDNVMSLDKDGNYEIKNAKGKVDLDKDGYLSYENTDDNKTQLKFTSSGFTIQDKNGCKIVASKSGNDSTVVINGHLTVKL